MDQPKRHPQTLLQMNPTNRPLMASAGVIGITLMGLLDNSGYLGLHLGQLALLAVLASTWYLGKPVGLLAATAHAFIVLGAGILAVESPVAALGFVIMAAAKFGLDLWVVGLVDDLRGTFRRNRRLASRDPLTCVANRRAVLEFASERLDRCKQLKLPISIAYVECAGVPAINENEGYAAADAFLRQVAGVLRERLRSKSRQYQVGRLSGTQFLVVLPEVGSEAARQIIVPTLAEMEEALRRGGWSASCIVRVSSFAEAPASLASLMNPPEVLVYEVRANRSYGASPAPTVAAEVVKC